MNSKEKNLMDKLSQNTEIPEIVWEKANTALAQIRERSSEQIPDAKPAHRNIVSVSPLTQSKKRRAARRGWTAAAAAAVVFLGAAAFLSANPALASRLPIIGRIFAQVEDSVTFSGDFSSKSQVLTQDDDTQDLPAASEPSGSYTVSDQGMTVTASEVYCDGMSIYLTFLVEYEGDLGEIPSYNSGASSVSQTFYTSGTWSVNGSADVPLINNNLDGIQIDAHTFSGMMRLDLSDLPQVDNVTSLELNLNHLGADNLLVDSSQIEGIGPMLEVSGTWDFTIPITVDAQSVKALELNDVNEEGYGLLSVKASPYQVTVYTLFPGYDPASNSAEALLGPEVAVFTQDGAKLRPYESLGNQYTFAVQNQDISSLQIFVGCDDDVILAKAQTPKEASQLAYYQTVVTF